MQLKHKDMSPYQGAYYPTFNPVLIIDTNGAPPELRSQFITELGGASSNRSGVFDDLGKEITNDDCRSSSYCFVNSETLKLAKNRLDFVVKWQLDQQVNSRNYELCEGLQFLKYDGANQGKFLPHTDNAYFSANGTFLYTSPQRILTTLTFLNDNFEGGEIAFPDIIMPDGSSFIMKPISGTTLIFPADIRYTHEVKPVTKGVRYSIVGWYGLT